MDTISLGGCPTCGGPAQFIDNGETRHVDTAAHVREVLRKLWESSHHDRFSDRTRAEIEAAIYTPTAHG